MKRHYVPHTDKIPLNMGTPEADERPFPLPGLMSPPHSTELPLENDGLFERKLQEPIHWSVGWADLMTTMFVIFALLYLFETVQREGKGKTGPASPAFSEAGSTVSPEIRPVPSRVEKGREASAVLYDLSRKALADEEISRIASVELAPDRAVHIILTGDLLFDLGKADLKPEARASLRKIAAVLENNNHAVNVVGHTDDIPVNTERFPSNWELSAYRAAVVARYLIDEMNLPADRFFVSGHASYVPREANDRPDHRAANRRVEIVISEGKGTAAPAGSHDRTPSPQEER